MDSKAVLTASTFFIDEERAFSRVGDDQPRLWAMNHWVQLRKEHFGEECLLIDSGTDPALYDHFEFDYNLVQLKKNTLSWDFFDEKWQPDVVNIFRFPKNILAQGWALPWSIAWLRGLCQVLVIAKFLQCEYLFYNELDLVFKGKGAQLIPLLPDESMLACPRCRYSIETGLMFFRMGTIDEAVIEKLSLPSHDRPETHIEALLKPHIIDLVGDRDENHATHEEVDIARADWLMHSSAEKMKLFYDLAFAS